MKANEFSIAEMFANSSNGKTSIGKVIGTIVILFGLLMFGYAVLFLNINKNFDNILLQSLALVGIGSGLIFNKINHPTKFTHDANVDKKENTDENNS